MFTQYFENVCEAFKCDNGIALDRLVDESRARRMTREYWESGYEADEAAWAIAEELERAHVAV